MCQFKSAIILREPRNKGGFALLHSYATDSHADLIEANNLRDDGALRFARVEFSPKDTKTAHDIKTYSLKIDEERTPEWFDDDMKAAVVEKLAGIVKAMMVPAGVKYLLGGAWIVPGGRTVDIGSNTLVVSNHGEVNRNHGTVNDNYGVVNDNYGTVVDNHGEVNFNHGEVILNRGEVILNHGTVQQFNAFEGLLFSNQIHRLTPH